MKLRFYAVFLGFFTLLAFTPPVLAQQSATQPPAGEESSYIDKERTAYITRIIPVPQTISPEAQKSLARQAPMLHLMRHRHPRNPNQSSPGRCPLTRLGRCIRRISNFPPSPVCPSVLSRRWWFQPTKRIVC